MSSSIRWLVVLVHPPTDAAPHPSIPRSGAQMFPILLDTLHSRAEAEALAARLRAEGATIAIVEEDAELPVTCAHHPPQLLGRSCTRCGESICAQCRVDAGGRRLCPACAIKDTAARRNWRIRQLFLIFLFCVFLFEVVKYQRKERAHLDPVRGISVAVFQFVPPADAAHPLVRALNSVDGRYGLTRVQDWYDHEFRRYTGATRPLLQMRIFGPWSTDVAPPALETEGAPAWNVAWTSWSFTRYWPSLARTFGAEPDDWDARVYIVYGHDAGDLAADSRGSRTGRIAVPFISLDDPNAAYAQLTVAHELGHILGGEDLYDDATFRAKLPLGLAEPNRQPTFPQRYAEVMAGDRPLSPTTEEEVTSLAQVRIGYHTAALMGWIEPGMAELHYLPRVDVPFGPEVAPAVPPSFRPTETPAAPDVPVEEPLAPP